MTRLFLGIAVLACASAATFAESAAVAPLEPGWLWMTDEGLAPRTETMLNVRFAEVYATEEPIVFELDFVSNRATDHGGVAVTVRDDAGKIVRRAGLDLPITTGLNRCQFTLNAQDLADGDYEADWGLYRTNIDNLLAFRATRFEKLSRKGLDDAMTAARDRHAEIRAYAAATDRETSPDATIAGAIAQRTLQKAEAAYAAGDWRNAHRLATTVLRNLDAARAQITFAGMVPEISTPAAPTSYQHLSIRNGVFYAGDTPVFLFGASTREASLREIESCGLNLALVRADHETESLLTEAESRNLSVTVVASPDEVLRAAEQNRADTASAARATYEALSPAVHTSPMVNSVCIANGPRFHWTDEPFRQGFIAAVRNIYPTRLDLNRAWTMRLRSYDDIAIWYDATKPAYHYDFQRYHQDVTTAFVGSLTQLAREAGITAPLTIGLDPGIMREGETRTGIDPERVRAITDVLAYNGTMRHTHERYALDITSVAMPYAFLGSFSPEKPIVNLGARMLPDAETTDHYDFVYAALWESVLSGLSGVIGDGFLEGNAPVADETSALGSPSGLSAFVGACRDINRLSPVVTALRQIPKDTAVLWSNSSAIYLDGESFLRSARDAFAGVSFSGRPVRFISERQCVQGELANVRLLIVPSAPAASDEAFDAITRFVEDGGLVVRAGTPLSRNPWGLSRHGTIPNNPKTILIRHEDTPKQYVDALNAIYAQSPELEVPRLINPFGYPLEGVRTLYVQHNGDHYLYVVNLRKDPVTAFARGRFTRGRDLIRGRDVEFPRSLRPLDPMLIRLAAPTEAADVAELPDQAEDVIPSAAIVAPAE